MMYVSLSRHLPIPLFVSHFLTLIRIRFLCCFVFQMRTCRNASSFSSHHFHPSFLIPLKLSSNERSHAFFIPTNFTKRVSFSIWVFTLFPRDTSNHWFIPFVIIIWPLQSYLFLESQWVLSITKCHHHRQYLSTKHWRRFFPCEKYRFYSH